MTDWKTIRIPEDAFERHNELRVGLGLTWEQYIDSQEPDWILGSNVEFEPIADEPDYGHIREIVCEEVRDALDEVAR